MSLKTSKKGHGLGKGISSLLGNFDIENTEEILDELERKKTSAVETLMRETKIRLSAFLQRKGKQKARL